MNDPSKALERMGLDLPAPPRPLAAYVPALRSGSLVWISGQLPLRNGDLVAVGPVPSVVPEDRAGLAAQACALNALAVLREQVGGEWARVERIVRLGVFVQSDPGYGGQAAVANGASELLVSLFGEAGRHTRAAVGVAALPLCAAVEIDMVAELRGETD